MASAHPIKNTSKPYACTNCGSDHVSVIREDPKGSNPRLKCNACQFMFDGQESLAALEAGAIKPSSPESLATADEPETQHLSYPERNMASSSPLVINRNTKSFPKRPAYVFIDREDRAEFSSKKDFKQTALRWAQHSGTYTVYELKPLKLSVDVKVV